jgi:hypothetical protein
VLSPHFFFGSNKKIEKESVVGQQYFKKQEERNIESE